MFSWRGNVDITPPDPSYLVRYLGCDTADLPNGPGCTRIPVERILSRFHGDESRLDRLLLSVSKRGLEVEFIDGQNDRHNVFTFDIKYISYCSVNAELGPRIFSWLYKKPKAKLVCHAVFCATKLETREVAIHLFRCFYDAYEDWKSTSSGGAGQQQKPGSKTMRASMKKVAAKLGYNPDGHHSSTERLSMQNMASMCEPSTSGLASSVKSGSVAGLSCDKLTIPATTNNGAEELLAVGEKVVVRVNKTSPRFHNDITKYAGRSVSQEKVFIDDVRYDGEKQTKEVCVEPRESKRKSSSKINAAKDKDSSVKSSDRPCVEELRRASLAQLRPCNEIKVSLTMENGEKSSLSTIDSYGPMDCGLSKKGKSSGKDVSVEQSNAVTEIMYVSNCTDELHKPPNADSENDTLCPSISEGDDGELIVVHF